MRRRRRSSEQRACTVIGNAENRIDPKKQIPLYDASGRVAGIGVIQNPVDNYNASPKLIVFGGNGKQFGMFDGYDGAMRAGFSPFKPDRTRGGSGAGGYKLTQGDVSMLTKYATSEDEMGNKVTDYGKVAFLQDFMQRTGYPAARAIDVYSKNVDAAKAQGAKSKEGAERAAMVGLAQRISGGGRPTTPTSQTAPSATSNAAPSKADARIEKAAAGENPGVLQNLGGEQQVPWYQEAGWGPRKLFDAWQGLKDSFDSKKRGNEIPPGY